MALPLPTFVQAACELMLVKAEEKGLTLVFDAATGLPRSVLADERRLRQLLLNLLGNAIKFTDRGTVTLRVSAASQSPSQVMLRLEVEDTGVGIRPDDLERIFQPFEQVGDAASRRGGTGLGLAITRALVKDMGGQVQVSSALGRGTRFRVELPLPVVQPAQDASGPVTGVSRYARPLRRVLVVDDDAASRALMSDFLAHAGFEVAQASDCSRMLVTAKTFRPDLIVMETVMPVLDGVEAMRRLRRDAELAAVPVIAVTASTSAEHRAACLQAGVQVVLTKPVSLQTLQAHVGQALGLQWIEPTQGAH